MKIATTTHSNRLPVTIQNSVFWMRSTRLQPPVMISPAATIISPPKMNCHLWLDDSVVPHLINRVLCPINPIPVSPGPRPTVTKASPKNAFDNRPAMVRQNEDMSPPTGCMTRLTRT